MALSPADALKLKGLMAEIEKKVGKEKLMELLDLTEKSEGESDEEGETPAAKDKPSAASVLYPNQGQMSGAMQK